MDVIGIGTVCVDEILEIEALPGSDQFVNALGHSCQGGGRVANALSVLGRLGVRAQLLGVAGDDLYGAFCRKDLEFQGVNASGIRTDPGKDTNYCVVLAERSTGCRSIIRRFGTCRPLTLEDLPEEAIRDAKVLHLADMSPVSQAAARIIRESGGTVVMDADEYDPAIQAHLDLIDVFICAKQYFFHKFPGGNLKEGLEAIRRQGPHTAIVTLGAKGCAGLSGDGYFELPIFPVEVADSTGAGDVFHGGYIYGLLQGWDARESARFASAVSAIKCTALGGRAGIPDLAMVREFLAAGRIDRAQLDRRAEFYRKGFARL